MQDLKPAPLLFTPGPLTTSDRVRRAMMRDWGSRDDAFVKLTAALREGLVDIAGAGPDYVAVPLQGSGTYAVEAALATFLSPTDNLLVLANGAYGERMAQIAERMGRQVRILRWPEERPVDSDALAGALEQDPSITHVGLVHCETTTGLLNPLEGIAKTAQGHGARLIVDAMSSFPVLPIDYGATRPLVVLASSNKGLEGPPGIGFALCDRSALASAAGNSPSLCLDLAAQSTAFDANGQWRFTPPVQVVAATVEALEALRDEGGAGARLARYRANMETLLTGMRALGFEPLLAADIQSPIIASFTADKIPGFEFQRFYDGLASRGLLIYPGKASGRQAFRIGCIGQLHPGDITELLRAISTLSRSFNEVEGGKL